jgi:hypothetical protein
MASIEELVCDELITNEMDGKDFLPDSAPGRIVTREAILSTFRPNLTSKVTEDLIEFILRDAKILFILTASVLAAAKERVLEVMELFRVHAFKDTNLPLTRDYSSPKLAKFGALFSNPFWTKWYTRQFYKEQWHLLAPVFTRHDSAYNFAADCVLPFEWKNKAIKEGAFSQVYQVDIHRDHYQGELVCSEHSALSFE